MFSGAFDTVDRSLELMRSGLVSLVTAHNATSRGELSRHRLNVRLEGARAARSVGLVLSDLRRKAAAARSVDLEVEDSSEEAFSRFVEKVSAAVELLEEASRHALSVRPKGKKVPREIQAFLRASGSAASVLSRVSRRGRSLLHSHLAAVEDDVSLDSAFD